MSKRAIGRRDFLKLSSLGLTGAYLQFQNGLAFGNHNWGGGGPSVIDPPPGAFLTDPVEMPNLSTTPGVVEVAVEAKFASVNVNGTMASLMTYNGYSPAPTIRINKGDTLRVRFKNALPTTTQQNILGHVKNMTNLHTHGFHVSPSGNSDNIFIEFAPGDELLFQYDTSKHDAGNLNFYHPHMHGLVAEQMWGGMAGGALVVEDDIPVLSGFETHILYLKDIALSGAAPEPYTLSDYDDGKEGGIVMVNGQVNPVLRIRPGQVQRWRIVNASSARFYKLSLEGHSLHVVGTDGGLLDKPYPVSHLLLSPGERADLLIKANNQINTYRLRSLPYDRGGNVQQTVTLMTLSYEGATQIDSLPVTVNPNATRLNMNTGSLPRKRLTLSMRQGKGMINGKQFGPDPLVITSSLGTYEVWEVNNRSGMDHPFHQHVNSAQVLSVYGGDSTYASLYTTSPARKDTIIVPRWGSMTMLVPVLDFTGSTVFHCHILEHEDIGMMGVWNIV